MHLFGRRDQSTCVNLIHDFLDLSSLYTYTRNQHGFESSLENTLSCSFYIFGGRHVQSYFVNEQSKSKVLGHLTAHKKTAHRTLFLCRDVATILLEDLRWKQMLKSSDREFTTPLRGLIATMPGVRFCSADY